MRRLWAFLAALILAASLCGLAVQAEGWDEEEEISLYSLENVPTPLPDPNATPAPTPEPEPTQPPILQPDGSQLITITAVGDVTIGYDVEHERKGYGLFDRELRSNDGDINFIFRNVKAIFEGDDLTIANFEGVLADDTVTVKKKGNGSFRFVGEPSYAQVLSNNSVEAVTMENNHIGDFGQAGIDSTANAIESVGVVWSNKDHMGVYETQGVRIGMLAYQIVPPLQSYEMRADELMVKVAEDIALARQTCDIVTVSFHWGKEKDYAPRNSGDYRQIDLGRAAIDAGADLVLGHHSHRINPIECYNGKYIVYSLANCSFAGNNRPDDMSTFIFQVRFRIKDGAAATDSFRIIPCRISSVKKDNNLIITPYTDPKDIDTVLNNMRLNSKGLEYVVEKYPLEWE